MINLVEAEKHKAQAYQLSDGRFVSTPEEWVTKENELLRKKSLYLLEARVTNDTRVQQFILDNIDLLVQIAKDPGAVA
jgi:hypothetical protein